MSKDVSKHYDENGRVKLQNKVIMFKPVYGIGTLTVQPAKDAHTGQMVGVRLLSEDEKRKATYFVTENTKRVLEPGFFLDLSRERDAVDWLWIKNCKGVALSEDEMLRRDDVYYYVYDEDKESEKSVKHSEAVLKALQYVYQTPDAKLSEKARLLNEKMESLKPTQIRDYLYSLAKSSSLTKVMSLVAVYEDPDSKEKIFLNKLVDKGIVKIVHNVYKFGDINLGIGEVQAVAFLKQPQNAGIVLTLRKRAYPEFFDDSGNFDQTLLDAATTSPVTTTKRTTKKSSSKE